MYDMSGLKAHSQCFAVRNTQKEQFDEYQIAGLDLLYELSRPEHGMLLLGLQIFAIHDTVGDVIESYKICRGDNIMDLR